MIDIIMGTMSPLFTPVTDSISNLIDAYIYVAGLFRILPKQE